MHQYSIGFVFITGKHVPIDTATVDYKTLNFEAVNYGNVVVGQVQVYYKT